MVSTAEAIRKFQEAIGRVDPRLVLDKGAVRFVAEPYPGVEYGLRLGEAGALLFVAEGDLVATDWLDRLSKRLEAAKHYLEGFSQTRR